MRENLAPGMVPLDLLSRALDEIYVLRAALAYEAQVTTVHISYKTFPKSRREIAERQVARMRNAACGRVDAAYSEQPSAVMKHALRKAGASDTLTRAAWEAEVD